MQKIAKKFIEVMKECSHVVKNGTNDFHKYKYVTAADVLEKVNTSLTKHGLASVVATNLLNTKEVTTAKGNKEQLVTVEVTVTLMNTSLLTKLLPLSIRKAIMFSFAMIAVINTTRNVPNANVSFTMTL